MSKKSISASKKAARLAYKATAKFIANKRRKIERHLKSQPNDEQAQAALKSVGSSKFRTKPENKGGWLKDDLRQYVQYLPFLDGKGRPIGWRTQEQYESLLRTHTQSAPLTKAAAKEYAQIKAASAVSHLQKMPVLIKDSLDYAWKHIHKDSNFKEVA